MPELTIQQINDIYTAENLTPVLVVLAGGPSYGHAAGGDYDYFAYHLEEGHAKDGDQVLYTDVDVNFKSWSLSDVIPRIVESAEGPVRAMFCIDHWLWHTPLVTTDPHFTDTKALIVAARDDDWMRYYAYASLGFFKTWKQYGDTKARNFAVRMALTVKYYADHGSLECDFPTLLTEYPIGTDEERAVLKAELKQLWLALIADRIKWNVLR